MPPKKAEEAAAPPAADDDGLAELATRALPPAFDDDALAIGKAGAGRRPVEIATSRAAQTRRSGENVDFTTLSRTICA